MKIEIFADPNGAAREAALIIAAEARKAVSKRGNFAAAFSRVHSPSVMLRALADEDVPWDKVHIAQVDERVAPSGDPDRNLTFLRKSLLDHTPLHPDHIHAMPVEEHDLTAAAGQYHHLLQRLTGSPPLIDLVHLGLGPDGHTASLLPGDPVLQVTDADVAVTGIYQGYRRMTLTYPILNRSPRILWLVTGSEKAEMLVRLINGDLSIPAGRVHNDAAIVLADRAAASQLGQIADRRRIHE
jgi:6-phosphogluconolactonase